MSKRKIINEDKNAANPEGTEVHEVQAQVTVPHEGGWGWVVVFASFVSIFILDAVAYTFGSMLNDVCNDLQRPESMVALVNSTAVALYFIASPFASALINRYGFRECAMSGSVICSFSLLITYFAKHYTYVFIFYGVTAGFGYSLINMSTGLVVGFYFEKLRPVALAIATCGSSMGIMACFPINSHLVKLGGWRTTTLLHSGLLGIIFFLGMAYRPLLSVTVTKKEEESDIRTLAYLPSVSTTTRPSAAPSATRPAITTTATERLFKAVSNANFPTAARVVESDRQDIHLDSTEYSTTATEPGPSNVAQSRSKLTLTFQNTDGPIGQMRLKQVQSIISRTSESIRPVNIALPEKIHEKRSLISRIFHWDPHETRARPLYRDDAFYTGKLEDLPEYQKSMMDTAAETKTGLEYQMAVTRAVTLTDLHDQRGMFTTAIRRVLATMMDPNLLRSPSFLLMCCSGFFTYLGYLVPYVYLQDRNLKEGIDPKHCTLFISAIGLSNAAGRLVLGLIASKVDPIKLFAFWCSLAGISTIVSDMSYDVYYQYCYCCVFGFSISSVACLRSVILVSLFGLDKLTNATGMMLIFLGLGNLISTPLAGILKKKYGYKVAFYTAGGFMTISGLILIGVKICSVKEKRAQVLLRH